MALKLSANTRFQDRPGDCKLIETAVSRDDQEHGAATGGLPRQLGTAGRLQCARFGTANA
jgi:hypothetical protein